MILEDYGKGVLCPEVIAAALEGARRKGTPVVVDPTGRDYRRYAGSTVLTPNLKEASIAAERPITDMASLEAAGRLLVEQTGGGPGHHPRGRRHLALSPPAGRRPDRSTRTCRPSPWPSST